VSYPESFLNDMPVTVAEEVLIKLSDDPVSAATRRWLAEIRGSVVECQAQEPMFPDAA
jgi:hypothetical protein